MTRRTTRVQRDRSELKDSGNSGLQVSNLFHLVRLAESLGAAQYGGPLSPAERELLAQAQHWPCPSEAEIANVVRRIREGHDPLGDALSQARKPRERRRFGQFLTPDPIVKAMVEWTLRQGPAQVVDAGAGTGRFAAAILRRSPETPVYAIELDPVASLLCRAHLAQLPGRATVVCADYLTWTPPPAAGPTAYIGNPPYVRHHSIGTATRAIRPSASRHRRLTWTVTRFPIAVSVSCHPIRTGSTGTGMELAVSQAEMQGRCQNVGFRRAGQRAA